MLCCLLLLCRTPSLYTTIARSTLHPGCNPKHPWLQPMHPGCNPYIQAATLCMQAATLCMQAATLCMQVALLDRVARAEACVEHTAFVRNVAARVLWLGLG